jgi:hypothetical protein
MFINFRNAYLRCFYARFFKERIIQNSNCNKWITNWIRISCNKKKDLYLLSRHSDDVKFKNYFKQYCKLLSKVILAAKELHYNRIFAKSNNKIRSTWKIIKLKVNQSEI